MNQNNHTYQIYQSSDIFLAPENAVGQIGSTDPKHVLNVGNFDGVYQYGSDFNTEWKCRQDGVAPQCAIPTLDWVNPIRGRVRFGGDPSHLNFIDAHLGKHYDWVITNISSNIRGYVQKRY